MKRFWLVAVFLLFWGIWLNTGVASAAPVTRATLLQTSSGECYDGTCYGYTLSGPLQGEMEGMLTLTLTYSPDHFGSNVTNNLSGYWVIDSPSGSYFGSIAGGSLQWNGGGRVADLTAELTIEGSPESGSVDGKLWDRPGVTDRARVTLTLAE
jgi:hypothetical protein